LLELVVKTLNAIRAEIEYTTVADFALDELSFVDSMSAQGTRLGLKFLFTRRPFHDNPIAIIDGDQ
jgi:hypothetical protein